MSSAREHGNAGNEERQEQAKKALVHGDAGRTPNDKSSATAAISRAAWYRSVVPPLLERSGHVSFRSPESPPTSLLPGCNMPLVASGAKQNVWLLRLGNVAKSHGWNLLSANIAMLVIPSARLNGESARIVRAAVERHQNPVATLNWKPPAAASTLLNFSDHGVRCGSVGNKCGKRISSWNPALHPRILQKLRYLLVCHGRWSAC